MVGISKPEREDLIASPVPLSEKDILVAREYWNKQLAGLEASLFPTVPSSNYVPMQTKKSAMTECTVKMSTEVSVNLSTYVYLAWLLLIGKYTNSQDILVGTVLAPGEETRPLRVVLDSNQTVRTVHDALSQQLTQASLVPSIPMSLLRTLSREARVACAIQTEIVIFSTEDAIKMSASSPKRALRISNQVSQGDNLVSTVIEYDTKVLDSIQITRLMEQSHHLLQQLVENPEQKIKDLSYMTARDHQNLQEWNGSLPPAKMRSVLDLIFEHCSMSPNMPAICSWDGALTYNEMKQYVLNMAQFLVRQGIGPGDFVIVCMEKSRWVVVTVMAILCVGAAVVPVDPTHPRARISHIAQKVNAALAVVSSACLETLLDNICPRPTIVVTESWICTLDDDGRSSLRHFSLKNPAFVIFTSGSTGSPKGVVLEHGNFSTSIQGMSPAMEISATTRALHFASLTFDAALYEIFTTLSCGGCVCIPSESDRLNDLEEAMGNLNCNWAMLTPSTARLYEPDEFSMIQTLVLCGEAVTMDDAARWKDLHLISAYGPTEGGGICVVGDVSWPTWQLGNLGNMVACVGWITEPDDPSRLVPIGAIGELVLEGFNISRCYINDPERTAQAFIDAPDWLRERRTGQYPRVYRTGDLCRFNSDGTICYLGRRDAQVKIRGQRVELGEIEYHICRAWNATKASTTVVPVADMVSLPQRNNNSELVAFIGNTYQSPNQSLNDELFAPASESFKKTTAVVKEDLHRFLPKYMIPTLFIPTKYIPLTVSGKTDRLKLKQSIADLQVQTLESYRTQWL